MKLAEALDKRIPRVRMPNWMPGTYLRLPLLSNGGIGPWAELYDPYGAAAGCGEPGEQKICVVVKPWVEFTFEIYGGPVHPNEQNNYARIYAES